MTSSCFPAASLEDLNLGLTVTFFESFSGSQRFTSDLASPTPTNDDVDLTSATGSSNACELSASSRTGSVYFDAEDPASSTTARLDAPTDAKTGMKLSCNIQRPHFISHNPLIMLSNWLKVRDY